MTELARTGTQISVFIENEPGTLARVAEQLGSHGINILALSLAEGIDHGYVRMVVDRPDAAVQVLRDARQLVFTRDVILLDIENRPGSFGEALARWVERKINIEYAYCAGNPDGARGLVVVKVDRTDDAVAALQDAPA